MCSWLPRLTEAVRTPAEHRSEVLLDCRVRRSEQLDSRNHDDVDAGRWGVRVPKNVANQSLSAVSMDRIADLFRRHDPEPGAAGWPRRDQEREEAPPRALAAIEDPLKL
jgi:hypothetical protein